MPKEEEKKHTHTHTHTHTNTNTGGVVCVTQEKDRKTEKKTRKKTPPRTTWSIVLGLSSTKTCLCFLDRARWTGSTMTGLFTSVSCARPTSSTRSMARWHRGYILVIRWERERDGGGVVVVEGKIDENILSLSVCVWWGGNEGVHVCMYVCICMCVCWAHF